jgi:sporulation protein YlmC with PRC-barrel domain
MAKTNVEFNENEDLISSSKIEGTTVYDRDGEKLGTIHSVMIDKRSGQADDAVLSFGGLFGLGTDYYPIPWDRLAHDSDESGYVVDIDKEVLEKAPKYAPTEDHRYDRAYGEQVHGYYGSTTRPPSHRG